MSALRTIAYLAPIIPGYKVYVVNIDRSPTSEILILTIRLYHATTKYNWHWMSVSSSIIYLYALISS